MGAVPTVEVAAAHERKNIASLALDDRRNNVERRFHN